MNAQELCDLMRQRRDDYAKSPAGQKAARAYREYPGLGLTTETRPIPAIVCKDGLRLSVQASEYHYCAPRLTGCEIYYEVEVGFPSVRVESLMPYAEDENSPTETVYGFVPTDIVAKVITDHGGVA